MVSKPEDFSPMPPDEGAPLPRGLGLRWPGTRHPIIHEAITDIGELEEVDVQSAFPEGCESKLSTQEKRTIDELIEAVPDQNDPVAINYWTDMGDKPVYLEGWCDKCLAGTGFPDITEGGWSNKIDYMVTLTHEVLPRKAKEKGYEFIEGGFRQFPAGDRGWLYGVTWGVFEKSKSGGANPVSEGFEIPKTLVTSLGVELELPIARAVVALLDENPWSSGFHAVLNQRWTIVFRGKISDKAVRAAQAAGLEVAYREAPKGSGQILTDVSLLGVGITQIEKATQAFNRFAELYEGNPMMVHRGTDPEAIKVAEKFGLVFDGMQEDFYQLTVVKGPEKAKGITFYVKDLSQVEARLHEKLKEFGIEAGNPDNGTCYEEAWRFLIKQEEGELVHGTVLSLGKRIGHAWVELPTGYIWEPQTGGYFKHGDFQTAALPIEEHRYTGEEAAIMLARVGKHGPWTDEERARWLQNPGGNPMPEYRLVKRTKRGSLVVITREGNSAILEISNMEDMQDISRLLNAASIKSKTEQGITKSAWEGTPPYLRMTRGTESQRRGLYPGITLTFDYSDLEKVLAGLPQLADYPDLLKGGNPDTGTSIIDLRGDYDEIAHVKGGILYRKGNIVQVWWDKWGKETWRGPSEKEARENFNAMKERWSSSEFGNPKEPWQMTQTEYSQWASLLEKRYNEILGEPVDPHSPVGREAQQRAFGQLKKETGLTQLTFTDMAGMGHAAKVRVALSEGKPVPPEVLADYPDLAARYGPGEIRLGGRVVEIPLDALGRAISPEEGNPMITDVDTALKDIADWYVDTRRGITEPELDSILLKHCGSEAEVQKFVSFLETEPGQLRFKTLLRERKGG